MEVVFTPEATRPAGHYSQAICANGFVFVSGQLGFLAPTAQDARPALAEGVAAQTRAALHNVEAIVRAAGAALSSVVSVTLYIPDVALWDEVNSVYERVFGAYRPARAIVPTRELHFGALIEISVIAVVPNASEAGGL